MCFAPIDPRRRLRRIHFATMLLIAAAIGAHVGMNGAIGVALRSAFHGGS